MDELTDKDREALTRLFDSQGWKIYENRLLEYYVLEDAKLHSKVLSGVKDLSEVNFQAGAIKGIEASRWLIQELKEFVEEGKEPVAEGQ
jgi:hypothetical protein